MKFHAKALRPLIYLSGSFETQNEADWLKRSGCKYRCYSYAYTCPDAFYYIERMENSLNTCIKAGVGIMIDSSGYSFHKFALKTLGLGKISNVKSKAADSGFDMKALREKTIESYVAYVKKYSKQWDFYVNFDYVKECPVIWEMQKHLETLGIKPIPVYHGDSSEDWFKRYCESGYKLIGIGSIPRDRFRDKRFYYDTVFNIAEKHGVLLHGLGQTSLSMMFMYPWYSVDSSYWVKAAAFGKIVYIDPLRNTIACMHVSDRQSTYKGSYNTLPASVQKIVRQQVNKHGFDFQKVRTNLSERLVYNGYMFCSAVQELKSAVQEMRIQWQQI